MYRKIESLPNFNLKHNINHKYYSKKLIHWFDDLPHTRVVLEGAIELEKENRWALF